MKQYYNIAGLTVEMDSFGRTVEQAQPYLLECTPQKVDMVICSNWSQMQKRHPYLSDTDGEYMATGSSFYRQLLNFNGLMLHSSAVLADGKAYLFSAPSGTGKSTHTSLWLEMLGSRADILNDDKPALRLEDGKWYAYGTPWSGKFDISRNVRSPIGGIAVLERAQENRIVPFSGAQTIHAILNQVVRPRGLEATAKLLDLLDALVKKVPIWKLYCNQDIQAAQIAFSAMSAGQEETE